MVRALRWSSFEQFISLSLFFIPSSSGCAQRWQRSALSLAWRSSCDSCFLPFWHSDQCYGPDEKSSSMNMCDLKKTWVQGLAGYLCVFTTVSILTARVMLIQELGEAPICSPLFTKNTQVRAPIKFKRWQQAQERYLHGIRYIWYIFPTSSNSFCCRSSISQSPKFETIQTQHSVNFSFFA
jgi:hypothetical protein